MAKAAVALGSGKTLAETAAIAEVSQATIKRWKSNPEFLVKKNEVQQDVVATLQKRLLEQAPEVLESWLDVAIHAESLPGGLASARDRACQRMLESVRVLPPVGRAIEIHNASDLSELPIHKQQQAAAVALKSVCEQFLRVRVTSTGAVLGIGPDNEEFPLTLLENNVTPLPALESALEGAFHAEG